MNAEVTKVVTTTLTSTPALAPLADPVTVQLVRAPAALGDRRGTLGGARRRDAACVGYQHTPHVLRPGASQVVGAVFALPAVLLLLVVLVFLGGKKKPSAAGDSRPGASKKKKASKRA